MGCNGAGLLFMCCQFHNNFITFSLASLIFCHYETVKCHFSLCNIPLTRRKTEATANDLLIYSSSAVCFPQKWKGAFSDYLMYRCTIPTFCISIQHNSEKLFCQIGYLYFKLSPLKRGTKPSWKRSSLGKWDTLFRIFNPGEYQINHIWGESS